MQLLDAFDNLRQQGVDVNEAFRVPGPRFGNRKNLPLRLVEQGFRITSERIQRVGSDFIRGGDQLPQYRPFANNFGVALDIGRRWRVRSQFAEVGQPAGTLALARCIQCFGDGDDVGRLGIFKQILDLPENAPVFVPVKVGIRNLIADAIPGLVIQQQAANNGLLRLDGMRRNTQLIDDGIGNTGLGWASVHGGQFKLKRPRTRRGLLDDVGRAITRQRRPP